jgi:hypothetical protein
MHGDPPDAGEDTLRATPAGVRALEKLRLRDLKMPANPHAIRHLH